MNLCTRACFAACALLVVQKAWAAGLYFQDRGVRPLARGGAFVAGADDLGAVYYNPAGIHEAPNQLLLDASWLRFASTYERKVDVSPVDPNTQNPGPARTVSLGKVEGVSPILPIPTLAASYRISDVTTVAAGIYAPYAALMSYPERVGGQPAPQRYALLSLDGSALSVLGAYVAVQPAKQLMFGLGPTVLVGKFQSTVMFGACPPDNLACAPEQPEYDAKGQLSAGPIVSPSATFGAVVLPSDQWRVGASFQLPYWVDANAQFKTRLPSAPLFDKASIEGEDAEIKFRLPWVARFGVEFRPRPSTRIELATVYERWSMHDEISVIPDDTRLRNVAGFPPEYRIGAIALERKFQDAYSVRFGGEQTVNIKGYEIDLRSGVAYETSAVPKSHLSVLTVDMNKLTTAAGLGIHIGERWRFDGLVALVFPERVEVRPSEARMYKVNPVRANRRDGDEAPINAGSYATRAMVLGMGLVYRFDGAPTPIAEANP